MKWGRFLIGNNVYYGIVEESGVIKQVSGDPLTEYSLTGVEYQLEDVKILAPLVPPMLYAAGPNYRGHVEGMAKRRGAQPVYPVFPEPNFRSVHAIIETEANIVIPKDCSGAVQPEGQLGVVIGKNARNVGQDEALDYVFGYTIGNDISQRVWQGGDRTMFRGKNCDTFKPLGPWIVTGLNPNNFQITVRHNGEVWEDFHSKDQIWDTATWIQELSRYTTLHVGDVLWMGTQGADGDMFPGDVIEVEISDIGVLKNYVIAED